MKKFLFLKNNIQWSNVALGLILFLFANLIMWKTFRVGADGSLLIARKVWSDFAATIPLIKSFSLGSNFPPQYPIFAGPPIRYHFAFFALIGMLERIGIPLDWSLNLPSAISLFLLGYVVYKLAFKLFSDRRIGVLSVVMLFFNGSLSFIEFFKQNNLLANPLKAIITNSTFPAFGPYDGNTISAFWNLNIYTNQRHLALAYAGFIFLVGFIFHSSKKPKSFTPTKAILLGVFVGIFPFVHLAVFGAAGIALCVFFLLYPKIRKRIFLSIILSLIIAAPQLIYMGASKIHTDLINPGYLIENLTMLNFLSYWVHNLGITTIIAPIGFLLATKNQRKIFIPFLLLFAIGNLFQFSVEIAANHKFFNLFLIGANMFSSYAIFKLWGTNITKKVLAGLSIFLITFSGFIELFPILNDRFVTIPSHSNSPTARYILNNTPKKSVFLQATYLYDPASMAGRSIYLGWPYFPWSSGYDTKTRNATMQKMLNPESKGVACKLFYEEGIDYVEIQKPTTLEDTTINYSFFENNFEKIHEDKTAKIYLYNVNTSCKQ